MLSGFELSISKNEGRKRGANDEKENGVWRENEEGVIHASRRDNMQKD